MTAVLNNPTRIDVLQNQTKKKKKKKRDKRSRNGRSIFMKKKKGKLPTRRKKSLISQIKILLLLEHYIRNFFSAVKINKRSNPL